MISRSALLGAAALALTAGSASAKGWYIGLEAGANWVADNEVDVKTSPGGFTSQTTARFDNGWAIIATVGYSLQNWRVETELAWRSNDKDRFTILPISTGDLDELTGMFNLTYAIPIAENLNVSLGGGAGFDYANLDISLVDDSDLNFAYQGIVSLDYALSPTMELTLAYRYLRVSESRFEEDTGIFLDFDDLQKHALTIGVRYTFAP